MITRCGAHQKDDWFHGKSGFGETKPGLPTPQVNKHPRARTVCPTIYPSKGVAIPLEFTVGIGGAAGDGLDKSGDTLAKTVSRRGLYVTAYNSYQWVIRGGHIWLRVRISEEKVYSHGDHINLMIALNQDSVERHAREVEPGGGVLYNSDRFSCDSCRMVDTLLMDQEVIYDSRNGNDRLLLGLKGSLNEYELDLLRQRSQEARRQKASRGELVVAAPIGYLKTTDQRLEKDPDGKEGSRD